MAVNTRRNFFGRIAAMAALVTGAPKLFAQQATQQAPGAQAPAAGPLAPGGAPAEFDQQQAMTGVISVAIIQLDEGPRVIGQLSDANPGELHIGMRVRAVARRLYDQEGIVRYGVKFSPVPAHLNVENQNGPG